MKCKHKPRYFIFWLSTSDLSIYDGLWYSDVDGEQYRCVILNVLILGAGLSLTFCINLLAPSIFHVA